MITSPIALSVPQCPTSATSSLELITPSNDGSKAWGKHKASLSSFRDDTGVFVSNDAAFVEDLNPLAVKPSYELMSSHVHKVMQAQLSVSYNTYHIIYKKFCIVRAHESSDI